MSMIWYDWWCLISIISIMYVELIWQYFYKTLIVNYYYYFTILLYSIHQFISSQSISLSLTVSISLLSTLIYFLTIAFTLSKMLKWFIIIEWLIWLNDWLLLIILLILQFTTTFFIYVWFVFDLIKADWIWFAHHYSLTDTHLLASMNVW